MSPPENPYSPPATAMAPAQVPVRELPEDILKKIKGGGIAAVVIGIMSLVYVILVLQVDGFLLTWALAGVVFSFLMAVGIFVKSRTCAVLMFLFFMAKQTIIVVLEGTPSVMWVAAMLLAVCLFQAIQGTFRYHSWKNSREKGAAV